MKSDKNNSRKAITIDRDSGVALVVVMLVSAVLLGVLLVITSNFAISSRRLTGEQSLILKARYAAESGIATSEARWNADLETIRNLVEKLNIPASEFNSTTLESDLRQLCQNNVSTDANYLCKTNEGRGNPAFFMRYISANTPAYGNQDPQEFWNRVLGQNNNQTRTIEETISRSSYTIRSGFGLVGVKKTLNQNLQAIYSIELGVPGGTLESVGLVEAGTRTLSTQTVQRQFANREIRIEPFNLNGFALNTSHMVDDRNSNSPVFFSDQTKFDGPVHTNESFAMTGNPTFNSRVTSAGCTLSGAGTSASDCINPRAELRVPTTAGAGTITSITDPTQLEQIRNGAGYSGYVQPSFLQPNGVNFNADFVEIKTESLDSSAAQNGRLFIAANQPATRIGNVTGARLQMMAVDANMNQLNSNDWQDGAWKKENVNYQYLAVVPVTVHGFVPCTGGKPPTNPGGGGGIQIRRKPHSIASRARYTRNLLAQTQPQNTGLCPDLQPDETRKEEYRILPDGKTMQKKVAGVWVGNWVSPDANGNSVMVNGTNFNGLVYVDGPAAINGPERVSGLQDNNGQAIPLSDGRSAAPAFAPFSKLAVAVSGDAQIYSDLKYTDPPCEAGTCRSGKDLLNTQNTFGMYSINGNISVVNDAQDATEENRTLHGSYLSANGRVGVENYSTGRALGTLNILGGINENYYGSFGTIRGNPPTLQSGYGRNLAFDPRFGLGVAPPFFPITASSPPVVKLCEPISTDATTCKLGSLLESGAMRAVKAP